MEVSYCSFCEFLRIIEDRHEFIEEFITLDMADIIEMEEVEGSFFFTAGLTLGVDADDRGQNAAYGCHDAEDCRVVELWFFNPIERLRDED